LTAFLSWNIMGQIATVAGYSQPWS